jgi:probable rRNA maturation factor
MTSMEKKNLYITSETGSFKLLLSVPVEKIKNDLLGKDYDLTLIYCSPKTSKKLNSELRDKDYPTNILSFPLDKKLGEIYICRSVAKRDAKNFNMSYTQFITLLIVHGCLHLKGLDHGDVMDTLENEYTKKYYKSK